MTVPAGSVPAANAIIPGRPPPRLVYAPRLNSETIKEVAVTPTCALASRKPPNAKSFMPDSLKRVAMLPLVKDLVSSAATAAPPFVTVPVKTVRLGSATAKKAFPLNAPSWLVRLNVGVPLTVTCVVEPAVQTVRRVQDTRRVSANATVAIRPSPHSWVAPTLALQRLRAVFG